MQHQIPSYSIESLKSTDAEPREIDLFRFQYFAQNIGHLREPHRHHFYTFILVTGGAGRHDIDFREYELRTGRLFLIAPGQIHAWKELNKVKGFVLLFTDSFMALSKGRRLLSSWPLFRSHQPACLDLPEGEIKDWVDEFAEMEKELQAPDEFSRDAIFYSISSFLVKASRMMRKHSRVVPSQGQDMLFAFHELIEKNFVELKMPSEYAPLLHVTPNHLNAYCKRRSGMTAGQLIRQRILLEAKRLLVHTKLSVSEIAYRLGFVDNSYFGRYFKKYCGTTPENFRNRS